MKMTQFAKFANNATKQILGTSGLIRENLQSMFSYPNAIDAIPVIVSGDVIHIEDAAPQNAENVTVYIKPVQDLHGYDNPWPAGGGKNLLNPTPGRGSSFGLTFTTDGTSLIVNGTNTSTVYTGGEITKEGARFTLPAGTYTLSLFTSPTDTADSYINVEFFDIEGNKTQKVIRGNDKTSQTFTFTEDMVYDWWFSIPAGTYNNVAVKFQLESGNTATSFSPYTNICPISGWTGANITVNGNTIAIAFPSEAGTVYGGTLDVTTGLLTVTHGNIASYNGESLPGKWISSMDVYSAGGTPTTGAQVVYELTAPQIYQLTPQQITLLLGNNTLYANCGSMELEYYKIEGGENPYV